MKRFDTVVKFATTADSNKLVSSMEDYARHYMSSKYDVKGLLKISIMIFRNTLLMV